ncbi:LAMI_0G00276g1_1 [Lachancea mirantina]|uniref:LAMI_0G00276g1_1 n=1 Tax=Lachancea mirantina TaxID=1230905 RepID=A0A1G4K714_9SACH|nr:LAMI_0G00276g1_1 [Lachancea mirantina]
MANFLTELWESIFSPGASPQLIIATHVSFACLTVCLGWLIYLTKNVHFMALLVISTLLWITVTWFVSELQNARLASNQDLNTAEATEAAPEKVPGVGPKAVAEKETENAKTSGTQPTSSGKTAARSRKV